MQRYITIIAQTNITNESYANQPTSHSEKTIEKRVNIFWGIVEKFQKIITTFVVLKSVMGSIEPQRF